MSATPTILSGVQITARIANVSKADAAGIATVAIDRAPLATLATLRTVAQIHSAFAIPRRRRNAAAFYFCS